MFSRAMPPTIQMSPCVKFLEWIYANWFFNYQNLKKKEKKKTWKPLFKPSSEEGTYVPSPNFKYGRFAFWYDLLIIMIIMIQLT